MGTNLFKSTSPSSTTTEDLVATLRAVGAHDCDTLFIHSGLSFGLPNAKRSRGQLLGAMHEAISSLGVRNVCVPTFTFSFCNGESYDVESSRSRMGALSEYMRKQPGFVRSVDPLMSVALCGEDKELVTGIGHESCGLDSTYYKLSQRDGVKFLFLGVRAGACFTYMHHLEWQEKVPYRYDRDFTGMIKADGREYEDTYKLFVRYNGMIPNDASYDYEDSMKDLGLLRTAAFGDGIIQCVSEKDASPIYRDLVRKNPNHFITDPFDPNSKDATFTLKGVMVAM
jgi:aminoglycoside 3-N-acetyltransferase